MYAHAEPKAVRTADGAHTPQRQAAGTPTAQAGPEGALNDSARVRSQLHLGEALNRSPRATAQAKLIQLMSSPAPFGRMSDGQGMSDEEELIQSKSAVQRQEVTGGGERPQRMQALRRAGSASPVQAKIVLPLASDSGEIASRSALLASLMERFGSYTSEDMLSRYIADLHRQKRNYTVAEDVESQVESRIRYDMLGTEKWREFIDAKDHDAAIAAFENNQIDDPGKYYDYRRNEAGDLVKAGDHYEAFMDADAFVSERLNTKLTAGEYFHINALASQGISSPFLKGVRTGEVTWGLPRPSGRQQAALAEKGLTDLREDKSTGGVKVHVPMPEEGMAQFVQKQLDRYYSIADQSEDGAERLSAVISLYQALEAMHPFKDATSRTNHLVLNKLLVENGLNPAILNEPNSPTSSTEEFTRHVAEGVEQTQGIANTAPGTKADSSKGLAKIRRDRNEALRMETMLVRYGQGSGKPIPPAFKTEGDAAVAPFYADASHLMGDRQQNIEHPEGFENIIEDEPDLEDEEYRLSLAMLPPRVQEERFARLILGNRRFDQYLEYKYKQQR